MSRGAWLLVLGLAFWRVPEAREPADKPEQRPPAVYVSKGACPFEGCVYREWKARKPVSVFDRPAGEKIVDRLRTGERVEAITGEVHCIPLHAIAERDHPEPGSWELTSPQIRKGQAYYLLHYAGEGYWQVWFQGAVTVIGGLSPDAPQPQTTWWAQVRTPRGVTGWVIATDSFDGQDMLVWALRLGVFA